MPPPCYAPPPRFLVPCITRKSAAWKKLPDTSLLRAAVSTWLSHGQSVVSVGVNAVCYCYMWPIVVVHVVLTLGQRRTGGPALNSTCVCWVIHR